MASRLCIKIHERDNVAIAIRDLPAGTQVLPGVVTAEDIPQAHKIALAAMPKGTPVYRYGVLLGHVDRDDAMAMQYLIPGWVYDHKKPCLVR